MTTCIFRSIKEVIGRGDFYGKLHDEIELFHLVTQMFLLLHVYRFPFYLFVVLPST